MLKRLPAVFSVMLLFGLTSLSCKKPPKIEGSASKEGNGTGVENSDGELALCQSPGSFPVAYQIQCASCHGPKGEGAGTFPGLPKEANRAAWLPITRNGAGDLMPAFSEEDFSDEDYQAMLQAIDAECTTTNLLDNGRINLFQCAPGSAESSSYTPQMWRLTSLEYSNSLNALTGSNRDWQASFPAAERSSYSKPEDLVVLQSTAETMLDNAQEAARLVTTNNAVENGEYLLLPATAAQGVVMDGQRDQIYAQQVRYNLVTRVVGAPVPTTDFTANIIPYYAEDAMYVHVSVGDQMVASPANAPIYEVDSVEVFIDNPKTGGTVYNNGTYHFSISAVGNRLEGRVPEGLELRRLSRTGGYNVEIKIPWSSIGGRNPTIGLDFHVNDADGNGRENKLTVFSQTDETYRDKSLLREVSTAVGGENLSTGCVVSQAGENQCLNQFTAAFGQIAYRRPINNAEQTAFRNHANAEEGADFERKVQRIIEAMLVSPNFMHKLTEPVESATSLDSYKIAELLAFSIWNSVPDRTLLEAATQNQLNTREQIKAQAIRLLSDDRALPQISIFIRHWLRMENFEEIFKDQEALPIFTPEVLASLNEEFDAYIAYIIKEKEASLAALFSSSAYPMSALTAPLYGVDFGSRQGVQVVETDANQRFGVLTHPAYLSRHAGPVESLPFSRGQQIFEDIICQQLAAVAASDSDPVEQSAEFTKRQALEAATAGDSCQPCHNKLNGIGLSMDVYDSVGRYRTSLGGKPIDASGSIAGVLGLDLEFSHPKEMNQQILDLGVVQQCFAVNAVEHFRGQGVRVADQCSLQQAVNVASENVSDSIIDILAEIFSSQAMLTVIPE